MSRTVSLAGEAGQQPAAGMFAPHAAPRKRRRRVAAGVAAVVVLGAGAAGAWRAGWFSAPASPGLAGLGALAPTTEPVVRADVAAVTPVPATLGYAGSLTVTGRGAGTLTALPRGGQVIRQGQVLYRVDNGSPVVLLYGSVPAWRALYVGLTGADVSQLNHDLVALGDAVRAEVAATGWDYFSAETAYGVQRLEEHLGVAFPSGSLSVGQVVFEPGAIRVAQVTGSLGGPASGPLLAATSDRHMVLLALDVSQAPQVKVGDQVTVTLPDGKAAPGVVTVVGTVATTTPPSQTSQQEQSPTTTIPVQVRLTDPAAAGGLDQAPVTVSITNATARGVLAVPVTALLARPGGYVVEVTGPGGARRYVPVTPGIFDDSSGLVQVTGLLTPGQHVVVPRS